MCTYCATDSGCVGSDTGIGSWNIYMLNTEGDTIPASRLMPQVRTMHDIQVTWGRKLIKWSTP